MSIGAPSKVEHRMVELKAKVDDLDIIRRKLTSLRAQHVGTFQQKDVYFDVPDGKLKLREAEGNYETELIYYERENVAGPKRSDVFIMKIQEPKVFKILLERLLKTIALVEKVREIYRYQGTKATSKYPYVQIHLDNVKKLGTFVEFEMQSSDQTEKRDKRILEHLMKELGIKTSQLEKYSYSELLQSKNA